MYIITKPIISQAFVADWHRYNIWNTNPPENIYYSEYVSGWECV
jgi:hypothetical protein